MDIRGSLASLSDSPPVRPTGAPNKETRRFNSICESSVAQSKLYVAMTPTPLHKRKTVAGWVHAFVVVVLLIGGGEYVVGYGGDVATLCLPFAWVTWLMPLVAVLVYAAVGSLLSRTRLGRAAWIVAFYAAVLPHCLAADVFEKRLAQTIPLSRWLEPSERDALRARFPHPFIEGSRTGDGITLRIRRSDYEPSLMEYLKSIQALPDA